MIQKLIELLFVAIPAAVVGWLVARGRAGDKIRKLENEKIELEKRTKIQMARLAVRGRLDRVDDAELIRRVATTGDVGVSAEPTGIDGVKKK